MLCAAEVATPLVLEIGIVVLAAGAAFFGILAAMSREGKGGPVPARRRRRHFGSYPAGDWKIGA